MGRLIFVEGIIGAGKSTFSREVGNRLNYRVFKEPVDDDRLKRFYSNPKKYAFHYQIHILHKRIGIQQLAAAEALYSTDYAGAIVDRSLFGDAAFKDLHGKYGNIEELDLGTYDLAKTNMQLMIWPPTDLVFLDVSPSTAFNRIKQRMEESPNRQEFETGITLDYLEALSSEYQKLISSARDGKYPWSHAVNVQYVDWNPCTLSTEEWDSVAENFHKRQWH